MRLREHFGSYAGGLEHALALATLAHATQRACGAQTGAHPVRMALVLPEADTDARTVALLHDVVEDSGLTLDDLRKEGFPEHIVAAVDALPHLHALAGEDLAGLDLPDDDIATLIDIDPAAWREEADAIAEHLAGFEPRVPEALKREQQRIAAALTESTAS